MSSTDSQHVPSGNTKEEERSGEWYGQWSKNWLFEHIHPSGRLQKRMFISKWASGEKTDGERFLQTLIIAGGSRGHAGGSGCAGRHDGSRIFHRLVRWRNSHEM